MTAASFSSSRGRMLVLLYVNDMIITKDDFEYVALLKPGLSKEFRC